MTSSGALWSFPSLCSTVFNRSWLIQITSGTTLVSSAKMIPGVRLTTPACDSILVRKALEHTHIGYEAHFTLSLENQFANNRPYSGSKEASLGTNAKEQGSDLDTKPTGIESLIHK